MFSVDLVPNWLGFFFIKKNKIYVDFVGLTMYNESIGIIRLTTEAIS